MLWEFIQLRLSAGKLGVFEYYSYRLYDDHGSFWPQKLGFFGWRYYAPLQNRFDPHR